MKRTLWMLCTVLAALCTGLPAAAAADAPAAATATATATAPSPSPDEADSPADLLDRPARSWTFDRWIRTPPLTQESLRGKVVLLRWFTEDCHYCQSTLPQLEKLRTRYGAQGLVVICVFHPKPQRHLSDKHILAVANRLGWSGPLAIDEHWSTLERWWFDGHPERNWTSVSFLMDRAGIVRWAHSGGEYHPSDDPRHARCARQYADLDTVLQKLLAEEHAGNIRRGE